MTESFNDHFARRLTGVFVGLGVASCVTATVASMWRATGTTPVFVYTTFGGSLRYLTTNTFLSGVPTEFIGAVSFALLGVGVLSGSGRLSRSAQWTFTMSVALILGYSVLTGLRVGFSSLPLLLAIGSACGLLVAVEFITRHDTVLNRPVETMSPKRRAVLAGVTLLLLAGGITSASKVTALSPEDASLRVIQRWYRAERERTASAPGEPLRITIFSDLQCPFCAADVPAARAAVSTFSRRTGVDAIVIARDFPLEPECNRSMPRGDHHLACESAVAIRATRELLGEQASVDLEAWLYAMSAELTAQEFDTERKRLGVDDYYRLHYSRLLQSVTNDVEAGIALGVRGTPTFFVNGLALPRAGTLDAVLEVEADMRAASRR